MSFGNAASRRAGAARVDASDPCPCGRGETFGGCCAPVLAGAEASTAEGLMRSRFTAFAVGDARHLVRTWHPRTRPAEVDLDPQLRWTRLEIVDREAGGPDDAAGVVEFRAAWTLDAGSATSTGVVHERSRFARLRDAWRYLDGDLG